ncbi:unnamed protein product [Heterobilharzia americana]|nr:unnamed protein product [Heterobilharzia americana]
MLDCNYNKASSTSPKTEYCFKPWHQRADTSDQLSAIVSQKLKELIELLELILLGVHGMVLLGTLENPSFLFTKILETFWSVSYGSSLRNLKAHHLLVEQLCFTQTLILIRAANLDSLVLYSTKSLNLLTTYPGLENVNLIPSCKSESIVEDLPISKNVQVADGNTTHFLYDSSLLNRLLASLSSLGEHKVHGPLLLFGAVCATAFTRSGSHSLTSSNHSPDSTHELPGVLKSRYSNNASMISDRCAQLAIQNLDVFHFLIGKLDQANCQPPRSHQWIQLLLSLTLGLILVLLA